MKSGEYSLATVRSDGENEVVWVDVKGQGSNCSTGCFPTANQGVREVQNFRISQIVKKAKTYNRTTTKLTGNLE